MKKKIVILIFITLAFINSAAAGFWIWDIGRKTELLSRRYESAVKLERSFFEGTSLELVISKLKEENFARKALLRKDDDPLKMTLDILHLLEKNKIKVISYRLEGEETNKETREELVVTGEGEIDSVLKLIYDLSFSKEGFRIKFISVDARSPERPAALVIRITYA